MSTTSRQDLARASEDSRPRIAISGRKAKVRARRWAARALLVATPLLIILVDWVKRRPRIGDFDSRELAFYLGTATLGVLVWSSLIALATRIKGIGRWPARVVLVVAALLAVGGQLYTFQRYGAYVNHRAVLVGTSFLPSIGQQLWFDRWSFARALLPCLGAAIVVPLVARKLAPLRIRARGWLCVDLAIIASLLVAFISPEQGAEQGQPPDMMYIAAMGQLARARWDHNEMVERVHPGARSPEPVPALVAKPPVKRNVVMIINESVRTTSICVEYSPNCRFTPFSNAAAKDRIPLTQMRSLDSTTAISLAVMWSGVAPSAPREAFHTMPLIWEFTHAAGLESSYYTSQNLLFGNSGKWLEGAPYTRHISATMFEQDATYEIGGDDGKLIDYSLSDLNHLKEPYLAVIHLSNTHFPYKIDPEDMPFSSQEETNEGAADNDLLNRYQDSIYLQDKAIGRFLTEYKKRPEAARSVIMYVSDHGEQMREKGAVGHTGSLFEQEIRVPFWIDAAPGMLTAAEEKSLRDLKTVPVTQLDVFPTLMDLMGLWDAPELDKLKARVPGKSLLRGGSSPDQAFALTNCSELWACAFKNWGAIRGTKKLISHQGAREWSCFDVATDPEEMHPLDPSACADLLPVAEGTSAGKHPF